MACGEVRWLRAGWNWCAPPKNSVKNWVIAGRTGGGELLSEILPENNFSLSINVVTDFILFSGENDPKCQLKWWQSPFDLGKISTDSIYKNPTIITSCCRGVFCKFAVVWNYVVNLTNGVFLALQFLPVNTDPSPVLLSCKERAALLPHLNILIVQNHWITMILRGKSTSYRSKGQLML